jgi:hypothetical protein
MDGLDDLTINLSAFGKNQYRGILFAAESKRLFD